MYIGFFQRLLLACASVSVVLAVGVPSTGSALRTAPPTVSAPGAPRWTKFLAGAGKRLHTVVTLPGRSMAIWTSSAGSESLNATILDAGGVVATRVIAAGWEGIGWADAVPTRSGGVRVFFMGVRRAGEREFNGLITAVTTAALTDWRLSAVMSIRTFQPPLVAGVAADSTPVVAWSRGYNVALHRGLGPQRATLFAQERLLAVGGVGMVADRTSGRLVLAWCAYSRRENGIFVQEIDGETGLAAGPRQRLPESTRRGLARERRTCSSFEVSTVSGPLGGVFVAAEWGYPEPTQVRVWRVGGGRPVTIAKGAGHPRQVTSAVDPEGRLRVAWIESREGRETIGLSRSNGSFDVFERSLVLSPPGLTYIIYRVYVDPQPGATRLFIRTLLDDGRYVTYVTVVPDVPA